MSADRDFYWLEYTDVHQDTGEGPLSPRAVRHENGDCRRMFLSGNRDLAPVVLESWRAQVERQTGRPVALRAFRQPR